jgi:hypothetical protein
VIALQALLQQQPPAAAADATLSITAVQLEERLREMLGERKSSSSSSSSPPTEASSSAEARRFSSRRRRTQSVDVRHSTTAPPPNARVTLIRSHLPCSGDETQSHVHPPPPLLKVRRVQASQCISCSLFFSNSPTYSRLLCRIPDGVSRHRCAMRQDACTARGCRAAAIIISIG